MPSKMGRRTRRVSMIVMTDGVGETEGVKVRRGGEKRGDSWGL